MSRITLAAFAALLSPLVFPAIASGAEPTDPCSTFTWNVGHERALFSGSPLTMQAGTDPGSAPLLKPDRLYNLHLSPWKQVHFPVALARTKPPADESFGGITRLRVAEAGVYRLSLEEPYWVDIAVGGKLLAVDDHQGRPGCKAPHKILEFTLPAGADLTLELLGAYGPQARITLTRAPDTPPHSSH